MMKLRSLMNQRIPLMQKNNAECQKPRKQRSKSARADAKSKVAQALDDDHNAWDNSVSEAESKALEMGVVDGTQS